MFLYLVGSALYWASSIYVLVLIARVVFDWARILSPNWMPGRVMLFLADWIYRLTDPPVKFLRRYIPPVRLGTIALDLGFLLLFIGVGLVGRLGVFLMTLSVLR